MIFGPFVRALYQSVIQMTNHVLTLIGQTSNMQCRLPPGCAVRRRSREQVFTHAGGFRRTDARSRARKDNPVFGPTKQLPPVRRCTVSDSQQLSGNQATGLHPAALAPGRRKRERWSAGGLHAADAGGASWLFSATPRRLASRRAIPLHGGRYTGAISSPPPSVLWLRHSVSTRKA